MERTHLAEVLIVEDDPRFQKQLKEYAGMNRCSAYCVGSLEDAKAVLSEWSYDLVFLDVQLPDGLSPDIVHLIPHTPVLYISEISDSALIKSLISKSPNVIGYLAKPIAFERFSLTLTAALNAAEQFRKNLEYQGDLVREVDRMRDQLHADLHDKLAQYLVGMDLLAGSIARNLDQRSPDFHEMRSQIDMLRENASKAKLVVREVARPLDGQDEGSGGLDDWVQGLVQRWMSMLEGVSVYADIDPRCEQFLDKAQQRLVFKVIREATTNAIRHGEASVISIGLRIHDVPPTLIGSVTDDGCGFQGQADEGGYGLSWMRMRMSALNGQLDIHQVTDGGASVEFHVPLTSDTGFRQRVASDEQSRERYRILFAEQVEHLLREISQVEDIESQRRMLVSLSGLSKLAGFNEVTEFATELSRSPDVLCDTDRLQRLQAAVSKCLSRPN